MNRRALLMTALAGLMLGVAPPALADGNYPTRPIQLVVPAAAGGVTDVPARLVADGMIDTLGQRVVVENHGGGGGIIGVESVKRARADGYTLLYVNAATHGILPALKRSIPYDAEKDFIPIAITARAPMAVTVRADSPYHSLDDLIEAARKDDGSMNYGSPGPGNTSHLVGLMVSNASGADLAAIHYPGEAPMLQALLAGELDFVASNVIRPHVEAGTLRVLATTGDSRWFVFPDVPTLKEVGQDAEFYAWSGFVAPQGTPAEVITKVNAAVNEALSRPAIRDALMTTGLEPMGGPPERFGEIMSGYIASVRAIGEQNGLHLE